MQWINLRQYTDCATCGIDLEPGERVLEDERSHEVHCLMDGLYLMNCSAEESNIDAD